MLGVHGWRGNLDDFKFWSHYFGIEMYLFLSANIFFSDETVLRMVKLEIDGFLTSSGVLTVTSNNLEKLKDSVEQLKKAEQILKRLKPNRIRAISQVYG